MALPDSVHVASRELSSRTSSLNGTTLPAQIYNILEEAIIRGDFAPGERLHADDVAAAYGVSRIPVREALRSLHQEGWVEIRPRYGTYVRDRSTVELRELFETRSGIEAHIAALAAQRRTQDELEQMERIVTRGNEAAAAGESSRASEAALAFSQARRTSARNSVLANLSLSLEKRARFYFTQVESLHTAEWANVEQELFDSIARQDAHQAYEISRAHIVETGREVEALLPEDEGTSA